MSFIKWRPLLFVLACFSLLVFASACGTNANTVQHHPTLTTTPTTTPTPTTISPTATPTQAQASPTAIPTEVSFTPIGTLLLTYGGHTSGVFSVAWSPDGTRIATSSDDGTAQVWNSTTGERQLVNQEQNTGVIGASWSPDGTRIVSSLLYGDRLLIWDAQTGQALLTYQDHSPMSFPLESHTLKGVTWSPNGKYIAFYRDGSSDNDNGVYVMDATTGHLILSLPVDHTVMALVWSPDSTQLAYGMLYGDSKVRIITAATGQLLVTYAGHGGGGGITSLSWSPDGKYIASGGWDTTVQIWNAADGQHVYTYTGNTNVIASIAWSPDGTRIASASAEQTQIQVWDALTGQHVFTYNGHSLWVYDLAWSPDGKRIASVCMERASGEVQVWQAG